MSGGAPVHEAEDDGRDNHCGRPTPDREDPNAEAAEEEPRREGADQDDEGRVDRERRSVLRLPPVRGEALLPAAVQDGLQDARHHECCDDDAEAGPDPPHAETAKTERSVRAGKEVSDRDRQPIMSPYRTSPLTARYGL